MSSEPRVGSAEWQEWRRAVKLDDYEMRFDRMEAEGQNPHGEVDFVMQFDPWTALDAGCGFGRVGIELAERGVEIVGVDLDPDLLERARRRAPDLDWRLGDLATIELEGQFDLVVVAGNVIGFVEPASRADAVRNCARYVAPGGVLVIGNQLKETWPTVEEIDGWCADAGLVADGRFGGWGGEEYLDGGGYAVTVHRRPADATP